MDEKLKILADKLGISRHFSDAGMHRVEYEVSEEIIKFFCTHFGYTVKTSQDIENSLQLFEEKQWKKTINSIVILRADKMEFELILRSGQLKEPMSLSICSHQDGNKTPLTFEIRDSGERKKIGRFSYHKMIVCLKEKLPLGYYDLAFCCGSEIYRSVAACVPEGCYTNAAIESGKLWGYSLQLYSLKSQRNWGVGDFTDLKKFVDICADNGADVIGLNPLNVLFHDFPENASPYSSISRLFLNPIYIDVEQVPGFTFENFPLLKTEIEQSKKGELIDYTKVYNLKINILNELFKGIKNYPEYAKQFEIFTQEKGWDLQTLATYQALYHVQSKTVWGGWCAWDKELQNPLSLQVENFRKKNAAQIEFFKFLQFEADRQLKEVYKEVKKRGLKVGLYRDLPVGVCKDSAELWADRHVFMAQSGAGAPPDAFFPCGQKWCLGAFNPFELKERAYEPYLKILRANMACAGALRIDHVMGLMRLFMIPDHGTDGTYVHYNFEEMLSLLALESHLHKCAIVGESIGNVPDGFLDKIRQYHIYSISVLWAERWNGGYGDFKMPRDYPTDAFISVGTHDMPPLKMWWFGYDIELMRKLDMLNDEERLCSYKRRELDRRLLLNALDFNGVWPQNCLRQGDYIYGEGYPEGIEEAVHNLLAHAPSKVVMLQLEDVFQVDKLQNLPGTDRDKYPNWRLRLPVNLEDVESSKEFQRHTAAVKSAR